MESEKNSRMLELFFRVLRGETVSVKAVAEEYGVSTKSVGRDIAKIQEFLTDHRDLMQQAELIYSYKDKAYHLSCDEFRTGKSDAGQPLLFERGRAAHDCQAETVYDHPGSGKVRKAGTQGSLSLPRGEIGLQCSHR